MFLRWSFFWTVVAASRNCMGIETKQLAWHGANQIYSGRYHTNNIGNETKNPQNIAQLCKNVRYIERTYDCMCVCGQQRCGRLLAAMAPVFEKCQTPDAYLAINWQKRIQHPCWLEQCQKSDAGMLPLWTPEVEIHNLPWYWGIALVVICGVYVLVAVRL